MVGNSTDVWNGINADPKSGGPITLNDASGNPTAVTLSYRSYGAVVSRADNIQPNANLMSTYLFNKKNDKVTVTLQNLVPARAYNLFL